MTDKIPEFDENGLLPVGDYEVTMAELRASILVQGPRDRIKYPSWDASWRLWLVDQLEMMVNQLWSAAPGSGICDKHGNELEFPAAFRQCRRDSQPKGIVRLIRNT
ncbi:MAG: hypothetical protein WCK15_23975 [Pirellula sp.]